MQKLHPIFSVGLRFQLSEGLIFHHWRDISTPSPIGGDGVSKFGDTLYSAENPAQRRVGCKSCTPFFCWPEISGETSADFSADVSKFGDICWTLSGIIHESLGREQQPVKPDLRPGGVLAPFDQLPARGEDANQVFAFERAKCPNFP